MDLEFNIIGFCFSKSWKEINFAAVWCKSRLLSLYVRSNFNLLHREYQKPRRNKFQNQYQYKNPAEAVSKPIPIPKPSNSKNQNQYQYQNPAEAVSKPIPKPKGCCFETNFDNH